MFSRFQPGWISLLLASASGFAFAQSLNQTLILVCKDESSSAEEMRKLHPSIGIDMYRVDLSKGAVVPTQGELKELPLIVSEISDGQISLEHAGRIARPDLREVFVTTISRVTGRWMRVARYYGPDGQLLSRPALERIATSLGLLNPLGVRLFVSQGDCKAEDRKF